MAFHSPTSSRSPAQPHILVDRLQLDRIARPGGGHVGHTALRGSGKARGSSEAALDSAQATHSSRLPPPGAAPDAPTDSLAAATNALIRRALSHAA